MHVGSSLLGERSPGLLMLCSHAGDQRIGPLLLQIPLKQARRLSGWHSSGSSGSARAVVGIDVGVGFGSGFCVEGRRRSRPRQRRTRGWRRRDRDAKSGSEQFLQLFQVQVTDVNRSQRWLGGCRKVLKLTEIIEFSCWRSIIVCPLVRCPFVRRTFFLGPLVRRPLVHCTPRRSCSVLLKLTQTI